MFANFSYIFITMLLLLLISAFKILREYERGVIFMLGRFYSVKGPGFIIVIPLIQQMERVDLHPSRWYVNRPAPFVESGG